MLEPEPSNMFCKGLSPLVLLVMAVAGSSAQSYDFPASGRFLVPESAGKALLQQCSRAAPTKVAGFWQPSQQDVEELESELGKYLQKRETDRKPTPKRSVAYHRQYIGFLARTGQSQKLERFIYGNFYPASEVQLPGMSLDEKTQPVLVCDGGDAFWGIVFRVTTKSFEKPEFNGIG